MNKITFDLIDGKRIAIIKQYLEWDKNNRPRLVLVDENLEEWSISEENTVQGGFATVIVKKSECFFFKK